MPYLRIFDPREGSREIELRKTRVIVGRQPGVDILLNHPTVSRLHALLLKSGEGYVLDDYQSLAGVLVNNEKTSTKALVHGDGIQIGIFILEYRTDDDDRSRTLQVAGDSVILRQIRMQFRLLPTGIGVRYRTISIPPETLFTKGDTLHVADGGILLPSRHPVADGSCIELELTWPSGKSRTLMGEVRAVLESDGLPGMCVKLHSVEAELHLEVIRDARRGSWQSPDTGRAKKDEGARP